MLASDVFVIRDDVQFVRSHRYPDGTRGVSFQAHTPVKAPDGVHLLTVPVKRGGSLPIHRTGVSYDHDWARKHVKSVKSFYSSSPNLRALLPQIEELSSCRFATLANLNIATICWAFGHIHGVALRIPEELTIERVNELLDGRRVLRLRRIILGSTCRLTSGGDSGPSDRVVELCKLTGADEYLCGGTARRAYLDADLLERNGIALSIQDWTCPTYRQQHLAKVGFAANLSILDLLLNEPAGCLASGLAG